MIHPARKYDYDTLNTELNKRVAEGLIRRSTNDTGLSLYNYTETCTYDKKWDEFTLMARGLILDDINKTIVATPFPKFFNAGELGVSVPDLPFEVYEKLDGSMITVYRHNGKWNCATRGSFYSDQAKWAENELTKLRTSYLDEGNTYIFEAVYKANKIVVNYDYEGLVLLGSYDKNGTEASGSILDTLSLLLICKKAKSYHFNSFSDLLAHAPNLTRNEEGFVVRFQNGLRVKIKGDEYKRVHALISNLSPLSIWNAMSSGDDLETIRRELPEEFWEDFDSILNILYGQYTQKLSDIVATVKAYSHLTPKEIGLSKEIDPDIKSYLFNSKKGNGDPLFGKGKTTLLMSIRPNGNSLSGYQPSKSVKMVQAEG